MLRAEPAAITALVALCLHTFTGPAFDHKLGGPVRVYSYLNAFTLYLDLSNMRRCLGEATLRH